MLSYNMMQIMKFPIPKTWHIILPVSLAFLLLFTGCTVHTIAAPKAVIYKQPSLQVEYSQFCADYAADTAKAALSYEGKNILINNLRVDGVVRSHPNFYVAVGNLRFRPRYPSDLEKLAEGTVINVGGECQGLLWGYIYFNDCWIGVVSGGLTQTRSGY
jgi:hypothetical protein